MSMRKNDIHIAEASLLDPPDEGLKEEVCSSTVSSSTNLMENKFTRNCVVACTISLIIFLFGPSFYAYMFYEIAPYSKTFHYVKIPQLSCQKNLPSQHKYVTTLLDSIRNNEDFGSQLSEVSTLLGIANDTRRIAFFNSADSLLISNLYSFCDKLPLVCEKIQRIPMELEKSEKFNFSSPRNTEDLNFLKYCGGTEFLFIENHGTVYEYFEHIHVKELVRPTFNQEVTMNSYIHIEDLDKLIICAHTTGGLSMGDNSDFIMKFARLNLQHCPNAILYIFTNDTLWIRDITNSQNIRIYEINDTIISIFLAQKVCDEMWLTSPGSKEAWWMGYMMHNQNNVVYRNIADEDKNSGSVYPKEWRKLGKSLKPRDILCSTDTTTTI